MILRRDCEGGQGFCRKFSYEALGHVPDMDVNGCKFLSILRKYMLKSTSVTPP